MLNKVYRGKIRSVNEVMSERIPAFHSIVHIPAPMRNWPMQRCFFNAAEATSETNATPK